ncbi:Aldo/keto reductase [Hortaea werneckii]|nr:Aldo/keto reductase [Hortaea werneckii]KAI7307538.1 Aldo/keto reductase [Hortaea werneckii]
MSGIKNVFGGAAVNDNRGFTTVEAVKEAFQIMDAGDCKIVDTATLYGKSEELLGNAGVAQRYTVDTKHMGGFQPGYAKKENVIADAENSKKKLGCNVDIYYIHAPDPDTPLENTLEGVNEVYKSGFFKRFGLSNYKAEDVEKVYNLCKEKGYPLPQVYQGNYSPVARKQEEVLFPTLRKLGMSFYAYSPIAGGFLTKTKQDILDGKGRFDTSTPIGQMYAGMYSKPSYLEALAQWEAIAKDEGISRAELAYRWVKYNSPLKPENGDAIIIGASSAQQLKETLGSINKGPLSDKAVKAIDGVWNTIKHEAPLDNYYK